eukprot:355943-Chlamydomonas_euryale.AAC.2
MCEDRSQANLKVPNCGRLTVVPTWDRVRDTGTSQAQCTQLLGGPRVPPAHHPAWPPITTGRRGQADRKHIMCGPPCIPAPAHMRAAITTETLQTPLSKYRALVGSPWFRPPVHSAHTTAVSRLRWGAVRPALNVGGGLLTSGGC